MSNLSLIDCYRILGVSVGAGIAEVVSSYKKLCRIHHPDVSSDPESEELMKDINAAYSILREKLKNESALRERLAYQRSVKRYANAEPRTAAGAGQRSNQGGAGQRAEQAGAGQRSNQAGAGQRASQRSAGSRTTGFSARTQAAGADREAYKVLYDYFKALSACDYSDAYALLCEHDKRQITEESFIEWRESVARLYHIKEFFITAEPVDSTVNFSSGRQISAKKFRVAVNEDDQVENTARSSGVEKLMIYEQGKWKVFLGYKGVGDLTRTFEERFEAGRRRDLAKRWEEYYSGQHTEFSMLSLAGMRKAVSRELYRQNRFGGTLTFAVISVNDGAPGSAGANSNSAPGSAGGNSRGAPGSSQNSGNGESAPGSVRSKGEGAPGNARDNGRREQLLRSAARTICSALRETDIPAYAGDGVFMILFVELRKKDSEDIIVRLTKKIRGNAGSRLGLQAEIDYDFDSWQGDSSASIDAFNDILKRHNKML